MYTILYSIVFFFGQRGNDFHVLILTNSSQTGVNELLLVYEAMISNPWIALPL